jgi:hypothetical protein
LISSPTEKLKHYSTPLKKGETAIGENKPGGPAARSTVRREAMIRPDRKELFNHEGHEE